MTFVLTPINYEAVKTRNILCPSLFFFILASVMKQIRPTYDLTRSLSRCIMSKQQKSEF